MRYHARMLAPKSLDATHRDWNTQWNAPFGTMGAKWIPRRLRMLPGLIQLGGLYSFQPNNTTREFEYPWAHAQLQGAKNADILEIGGGLSGFQFTLAKLGHKMTNLDPGLAARGKGWTVNNDAMATLNKKFGTSVTLKNCFIEEANLADESFDYVMSISTIEHIPEPDIETILSHVKRVLRPGGKFILTLDLFLDVEPFTKVSTNKYGKNVSAEWLVNKSGLELEHGVTSELFGFSDFSHEAIEDNLERYLVGRGYPALVQTMVLTKK